MLLISSIYIIVVDSLYTQQRHLKHFSTLAVWFSNWSPPHHTREACGNKTLQKACYSLFPAGAARVPWKKTVFVWCYKDASGIMSFIAISAGCVRLKRVGVHPNIVRLLESYSGSEDVLVLEYCDSCWAHWIEKSAGSTLPTLTGWHSLIFLHRSFHASCKMRLSRPWISNSLEKDYLPQRRLSFSLCFRCMILSR